MAPFIKPPTISDDYRSTDLYRQAADVFYELGFEASTMNDLAEAVDLTQGGLYYYIKGKKALLFAIMTYALDRIETEVIHPARRLEDPRACLTMLLGGYLSLVLEDRSALMLLAEEVERLEPGHRRKIASRKALFLGFLTDVTASLLQESGLSDMDPAAIAERALDRLSSVGRTGEPVPDESALVDEVIRQELHGFPEEPSALAC